LSDALGIANLIQYFYDLIQQIWNYNIGFVG